MVQRKIPATLFLVTDRIREEASEGENRAIPEDPLDEDVRLSWSEVMTLHRGYGFHLGSHTCSHTPLTALSPNEVDRELIDAYRSIASRFEADGLSLAYPKGEYTDSIARRARQIGYRCAWWV